MVAAAFDNLKFILLKEKEFCPEGFITQLSYFFFIFYSIFDSSPRDCSSDILRSVVLKKLSGAKDMMGKVCVMLMKNSCCASNFSLV